MRAHTHTRGGGWWKLGPGRITSVSLLSGCGVCVRIRPLPRGRPARCSPVPWRWVHSLPGWQLGPPGLSWPCDRVSLSACTDSGCRLHTPGPSRSHIRVGLTAEPGRNSAPSSAVSSHHPLPCGGPYSCFLEGLLTSGPSFLPSRSDFCSLGWGAGFLVLHLLWSVRGPCSSPPGAGMDIC